MDLYRLSGRPDKRDLLPLNLDFVFENCISLIEWPSRLGDLIPSERLDIQINIFPEDEQQSNDDTGDATEVEDRPRRMILEPRGSDWEERIRMLRDEGYLDDLAIDYHPEQ